MMLAKKTAATIRGEISDGVYSPGQSLNEVHIAAEYNVSRNTLREAFAMLVTERLVERIAHRGVFIVTPDVDFVADLYRARIALETAGAQWGSELDAQRLLSLTSQATQAAAEGDVDTVSALNQQFHRTIVEASGSETLNREMDNLLARMRLTFLLVLPIYPTVHSDWVKPNAQIAQLLADNKRAEAARLLHETLNHTFQTICAVLQRL